MGGYLLLRGQVAQGLYNLHETIDQVWGRAEGRQVEGAEIGIVHGHGGPLACSLRGDHIEGADAIERASKADRLGARRFRSWRVRTSWGCISHRLKRRNTGRRQARRAAAQVVRPLREALSPKRIGAR